MSKPYLSVVLAVLLAFSVILLFSEDNALRFPGNNKGYSPVQPIAFSHELHAGVMEISCFYCHSGAERSPVAGIPAASTCMNCHRYVHGAMGAAGPSPELAKLYAAQGLDQNANPVPGAVVKPIEWIKVHDLPAFVHFDHSAHIARGVACLVCHGMVQTMPRVRQYASLNMGFCINCHRAVNLDGVGGVKVQAPLDCSACHH